MWKMLRRGGPPHHLNGAEKAREALQRSLSEREDIEVLAVELERIKRQNNLAPRISAAFRLHNNRGDG